MAFYLKDKVGWEAAPAAQFDKGSSSDQQDSGACRGERFVLREDMPDGLDQLAGDVDPGNLGATLATQAFLVPLVALPIAGIASGVSSGFDERPAEVLGPGLGQRPSEVALARLTHEWAQPVVSGQLLAAREPSDVADLWRNR